MSRFTGMSIAKRRAWSYGLIAFFVLLIGLIGFSQWWAVNKNVPAYERANAARTSR
jgi:multidrug resistance efflux pump